jgi:hypothetical protein
LVQALEHAFLSQDFHEMIQAGADGAAGAGQAGGMDEDSQFDALLSGERFVGGLDGVGRERLQAGQRGA